MDKILALSGLVLFTCRLDLDVGAADGDDRPRSLLLLRVGQLRQNKLDRFPFL
jgi:hypothetical protein